MMFEVFMMASMKIPGFVEICQQYRAPGDSPVIPAGALKL
jgi:hypothetical protein